MTKSFADAFGSDAKLMRSTGGTSSPFYIDATTATPTTNWMGHDVKTYSGGQWRYNPATQAFDYYATNPNGNALLGLLQFQDQSSKSISAADLGLTDPAYQIASLASLAGQNGDSWSNYALAHNDYGGGVGSASSMMAGARDLRNAIGDINSYEAKRSGWESFMDKAWMVPLMVAGAGLLGPAGASGASATEAGAGAGTLGATEAGAGGGYFGGVGAAPGSSSAPALFSSAELATTFPGAYGAANAAGSSAIPGLGVGAAAGSSAIPGLGVGAAAGSSAIPELGVGAAAGSSSAPALFSGAELATTFPGAYGAANAAGGLGAISSAANAAGGVKSLTDVLMGSQGLGALAGGLLGATGGAKQAGVTTTTQAPWEPMQPYLLDAARAAQQNYNASSTLSPLQQSILGQAQTLAAQQLGNPALAQMQGAASSIFGQPSYNRYSAGDIKSHIDSQRLLDSPAQLMAEIDKYGADPYAVGAAYGLDRAGTDQWARDNGVTLPTKAASASPFAAVSPVSISTAGPASQASAANGRFDFGLLGAIGGHTQDAYTRMLSGKADTTTLDPVVNSALRRLSDNFNEQVVPNIGGSANVSGQYGGSRHGIAEGLAAKGLAQSMGDTSAAMYNSAYNNAQNLMGNAAGQLGGFATSIANNNASLATQTNIANANAQNAMNQFNTGQLNNMAQFNANLGLQNNSQRLNQMNSAADWLNTSNNMQNTAIKNSLDLANYKNTYANDALNNYTGTIGKFAGMGGTASQPYYTNPTNNLLGGAIAGSQIFKSIFS